VRPTDTEAGQKPNRLGGLGRLRVSYRSHHLRAGCGHRRKVEGQHAVEGEFGRVKNGSILLYQSAKTTLPNSKIALPKSKIALPNSIDIGVSVFTGRNARFALSARSSGGRFGHCGTYHGSCKSITNIRNPLRLWYVPHSFFHTRLRTIVRRTILSELSHFLGRMTQLTKRAFMLCCLCDTRHSVLETLELGSFKSGC
jgi:hypothetical protein